MNIKILGAGCKKCLALGENVKTAADNLGVAVDVEKITDAVAIAGFGVMSTPGLVVDNKVVSYGRVLTVEEIGVFLQAQN